MPQYCSIGHENPNGSHFCHQCGEKLALPVSQGVYPGMLLGERYQIIQQLGQGGFGRTYLAKDLNRFGELCVLKEFAPLEPQNASTIQKAEELFQREASILYKLQHPQIPRFRELFRVNLDNKRYLFLVQDYVAGQNYQALLEARQHQSLRFSESEVHQLLLQILPVLEYIHAMGVIHRDISPDNLIQRSSDFLPILIDFGGVKQVAATVAQYTQHRGSNRSVTVLGKLGYAPREQMQLGLVYPHSDLYALAATVLVLLTGKEPQQLIDPHTMAWNWRREVNISPSLGTILDKMLQLEPGKRYQSAREVLQALTGNHATQSTPTQATLAIAGAPNNYTAKVFTTPLPAHPGNGSSLTPGKILIMLLLLPVAAGIGWAGAKLWLQSHRPPKIHQVQTPESALPPESSSPTPAPQPTSPYSPQEQAQRQALFDRGRDLGIDQNFLFGEKGLVNQVFYSQHPELQGRTLTPDAADANLRFQWYKMADQLLNTLKQYLSPQARQQLGSYQILSFKHQVAQLRPLHISRSVVNALTDAQFFELFPEQQGQNFIHTPIGQVWQAIASDKVNAIQAGKILEEIRFDPGATSKTVSNTLSPGDGKVYTAGLTKDQILKVDLQANPRVWLSIYTPNGEALLEQSTNRTWSGQLPESGFYKFVVASTAPGDYQLKITAEDVTPTTTNQPSPSDTSTPTTTNQPSPSDTSTPSPSPTETAP